MVTHAKAPDRAHQALVDQMHATLDHFPGMPGIEKIAMLGQVIGHLIADLPDGAYGPGELMQAVALNIASGNRMPARTLEGSGGLVQ